MKKYSISIIAFGCIMALASCVSKRERPKTTENLTPQQLYLEFASSLARVDVAKINGMLVPTCEFKECMSDWYSFYRDGKNMIGPFRSDHFRNNNPLHLVRPSGIPNNNYSRFHVFGRHYDLYLSFEGGMVSIDGTGDANSKSRTSQQSPAGDTLKGAPEQ